MFYAARTVTILNVLVQIVAFVRTVIIAAAFGASNTVDAYYIGLVVPSFLSTIFLGWLQVGFVGRYTEMLTQGDRRLAVMYLSRFLWLLLVVSLACSAACALYPDLVVSQLIKPDQAALRDDATAALAIAGWSILPLVIGDFLSLVLNTHGRFFMAALGPLVNAIVSVLTLWLWPQKDLLALTLTLLFGAFAQFFVIASGFIGLRQPLALRTRQVAGEVSIALRLSLPLLPAMMLANATTVLVQVSCAGLGEGAVSVYGYASRLHAALSQVLVIGLSTVLLPHLATLWAQRSILTIDLLFRRLVRITMLIAVFLLGGIAVFGQPAVEFLFGRGRFDSEVVREVAFVWLLLSFSIFPFAFGTFIAKLAQAKRQSLAILMSSIASFLMVLLLTNLGSAYGSLTIVSLSQGFGFVAAALFWVVWYLRTLDIPATILSDFGASLIRSAGAVVPAIAVDWLVLQPALIGEPVYVVLLVRGFVYTTVTLMALVAMRQIPWFLKDDAINETDGRGNGRRSR